MIVGDLPRDRVRLIAFPQEPLSCAFHQEQIGSGAAKFIESLHFDVLGDHVFIVIIDAWIEWLGLACRFQILGQLPGLEDRLDLGNEGRDFRPKVGKPLGGFEISRNFSPIRYVSALSVPNSSSIIRAASHFSIQILQGSIIAPPDAPRGN
jgi:hypothetical protein